MRGTMLRRLSTLLPGQSAVIRKIDGETRLRRRLLELGLLPGTVLTVSKRAPFGDPLQLHLRGYALTLRSSDAEKISVEVKNPCE